MRVHPADFYIGLRPDDVIGAIKEAGLAYDAETASGVALHLLGALRGFGKLGATCIAATPQEAQEIFDGMSGVLDGLATLRRAT